MIAKPPKILYIYQFEGKIPYYSSFSHPDLLGIWQEEQEVFVFFKKDNESFVKNFKKVYPDLNLKQKFEVDYASWHGGEIRPVSFEDFTIVPIWLWNGEESDNFIVFDPSVVFGTPNHTTTLNCIKAIKKVFEKDKIDTVLDMGSGTGILGAVAYKLGAHRVISFDINYLAAKITLKNFKLNRFKNYIVFQARAEDFYQIKADLVLANLPFFVIKSFIDKENFWINKKWVIISGLFPSQKEILFDLISRCAFKEKISLVDSFKEDWPTFTFKVL